jgi:tryptophan halogenase
MLFNRHITDIEEAKDYFTSYWNGRIAKDKIRVIDWDPFYIQDQWCGNVVNIGLSAGFIEPLESTGIGLITVGVTRLHNAIQERYASTLDQEKFNLIMNVLFEECVDFVSAHYVKNTRTSKFWQFVKDKFSPSDRMLHQISELSNKYVSVPYDGKYDYMFTGANWSLLLIQLGYDVGSRDTNLPKDRSLDLIIGNYVEHEKHRYVWGRHHSTEIDRISELTNTLKNI